MKEKIGRRKFVKGTAGVTFGTLVIPGSALILEACDPAQSNIKSSGSSAIRLNLNWEEMMKDHDLIWKKAPSDMKEAPHFGNGRIGSMIWVDENRIRLQVFRADVHDHADHTYGWSAYSRPRYLIGFFLLQAKRPDHRV